MSSQKQNDDRARKLARRNGLLYGVAAVLLVAAGLALFARRAGASVHPRPRANAMQMTVPQYGSDPATMEVYTMAAQIKSTLDGIFCYCYCKGAGHYSLLDCFRDDHGAGCDICQDEVRVAYQMLQQGASLQQIRDAIDAQFGS